MLSLYNISCDANCPAACSGFCVAKDSEQALKRFIAQRPFCHAAASVPAVLVIISSETINLRQVELRRLTAANVDSTVVAYVETLQLLERIAAKAACDRVVIDHPLYYTWLCLSTNVAQYSSLVTREVTKVLEAD